MIEAKIKGITIIWIRARNKRPGNANQSPMTAATRGLTMPAVGPIRIPTVIPASIAMSICSHSFARRSAAKESLRYDIGLGKTEPMLVVLLAGLSEVFEPETIVMPASCQEKLLLTAGSAAVN